MINSIIDISHYNVFQSMTDAKQAGILGILHKATQGTGYFDPTFLNHRDQILASGLLFGAYHFGIAGDPEAQADFFLSKVGKDTLIVLDFEGNPQGQDMSLLEAEQFVHYINQVTGRYSGLYSGHAIKEALANAGITQPQQTELSNCWLWISQYTTGQPLVPKIWSEWTLWQYTDGAAGNPPYDVNGIGRCDRDYFNGTEQELTDFWARNSG
jgi:lysozyme